MPSRSSQQQSREGLKPREKLGLGSDFPSLEATSTVDQLVMAMDAMTGKGRGRNTSIRKSSHAVASAPDILLTSYTCPEHLYARDPPVLPTLARGLFVTTKNPARGQKCRIAVRGYDKFFNVGENSWTTRENLRERTRGPFEATVKENGCIIFMSQVDGHLVVTSKHSIGPHAEKGMEWAEKHIRAAGRTKKELVEFLATHDVTAIFELADDDFEEHVLEYPVGRRGLYLHGINDNTPEFSTWSSDRIVGFADQFGFMRVDYLKFQFFDEVMSFAEHCAETGSYQGRPVEGFVIRCLSVSKGATVFFKYKFEEPYLMYREWREITKFILSGRSGALTLRHALSQKYVDWVKSTLKRDRSIFAEYTKGKGIIRARNLFLDHIGLQSSKLGDIMTAAQETTDEFKRGEAATFGGGEDGEPPEFSRIVSFSGDANHRAVLRALSLDDPANVVPTVIPPPVDEAKPSKILIFPVAIVGLGKTTLGKALTILFPERIVQVQSDDTRKKFVQRVMEKFKAGANIVYADKCNQMDSLRKEITGEFRKEYPDGRILAVEWDLPVEDPQRRAQIFQLAESRIRKRGENHQTLTPGKNPDFYRVIGMFLKQFQPVNTAKASDAKIQARIKVSPESTTATRLKAVCEAARLPVPSDDAIAAAVEKLGITEQEQSDSALASTLSTLSLSEDSPQEVPDVTAAPARQPPPTPSTPKTPSSTESPVERKSSSKKLKAPFYYGILLQNHSALLAAITTLISQHRSTHPELMAQWDKVTFTRNFHVTLIVTKIPNPNLDRVVGLFNSRGAQSTEVPTGIGRILTPPVKVRLGELVFGKGLITATVVEMREGPIDDIRSLCLNDHPHVTVGMTRQDVKPVVSNDLLEAVASVSTVNSKVDGVEVGDGWWRLPFRDELVLDGLMAEFLW